METFLTFYQTESNLKNKKQLTFTFLLLALVGNLVYGNTYEIIGTAPGSEGKQLTVLSYEEYFTLSMKVEETVLIDPNGDFKLHVESDENDLVILRVGAVNAQFYLGSSHLYHVTFDISKAQVPVKFTNTNWCSVSFIDLNPDDINVKMESLNRIHAEFYDENYPEIYQILSSPSSALQKSLSAEGKKIDMAKRDESQYEIVLEKDRAYKLMASFDEMLLAEQIDAQKEDYISISARYMMAELESLLGRNEKEIREKYCQGKLYLTNLEFISFYKSHYRNVFEEIYLSDNRNQFVNQLYKLQLDSAIIELKPLFPKDKVKNIEFILLAGIENGLNLPNIPSRDVTVVLELILREGIVENKFIATNFRRDFAKGMKGYVPENFLLLDLDDERHELESWRGQFVYISVFSSWNTESCGHQEKVKELERKFGNQIKFVSICMDEDWSSFQDFLIEHRTYNWLFLFGNGDKLLKEKLNLVTVPQYFLLNPNGEIMLDYTFSPEEGITDTLKKIVKN